MLMQEIRTIAKDHGIKAGRQNKIDLIRSIQRQEGNFDCFGTAADYCDQSGCLWRGDCLGSNKQRKQ